jgi:hypothetical protein
VTEFDELFLYFILGWMLCKPIINFIKNKINKEKNMGAAAPIYKTRDEMVTDLLTLIPSLSDGELEVLYNKWYETDVTYYECSNNEDD